MNRSELYRASGYLSTDRENRSFNTVYSPLNHPRYFRGLKKCVWKKEDPSLSTAGRPWSQMVSHVNPNALWCGFCEIELESVDTRTKHVEEHFKAGRTMEDWTHEPFPWRVKAGHPFRGNAITNDWLACT